jgi:hypothetical protein
MSIFSLFEANATVAAGIVGVGPATLSSKKAVIIQGFSVLYILFGSIFGQYVKADQACILRIA